MAGRVVVTPLELAECVVTTENVPDEVELFELLEPVDVAGPGEIETEVLPGIADGMVSTVPIDPSLLLHRKNVRWA